jgi:hypothetical protein
VCAFACGVSSALAGHFTRGLPPCGSCVAAARWHWLSLNRREKWERRAGDVNPPVTVRSRAAGAHQVRYRPIDIDRTPAMTGAKRFNGERVLQGIRNTRKSMPLGGSLRLRPRTLVPASARGVSSALAGHFTRGLPPCGSCVAAARWHWLSLNRRKKWERRAGDVNPPVTVRNRAGSAAAGADQCLTGRLTSTARLA